MKFIETIKEQIQPEWTDFYINYTLLLQILSPLRSSYKSELKLNISFSKKPNLQSSPSKHQPHSTSKQLIDNDLHEPLLSIPEEDENYLNTSDELITITKKKFFTQLKIEVDKFNFFVQETHNNRHKKRMTSIIEQLSYIKRNKEYKMFNDELEKAFKCFYRDISTFQQFINTNILIKQKIISKYIKYASSYEEYNEYEDILTHINTIINKAEILNQNILKESEKRFSYFFHQKYNMHPIKVLKTFLQNKLFTPDQSFYLGIVIGLMLLLLLLCIILGYNKSIDFDEDPEFRSIFPIYRTFGILCLYLWTLCLNVVAWNDANINYKALFAFDNHYSDVITICKRCAFFTAVLLISILTYMIIRTNIPLFTFLNETIAVDMLPLLCWFVLLCYFFCPFKIFNYNGRIYTMKLFVESVASIFVATDFRHIWFMDQLTSLIGPMRDIEYTFCYYSYYVDSLRVREMVCNNTRGIYLIVGIFPNFCRVLQCIRVIKDKQQLCPQIFNIGKYTFNIVVCTFSFLTNIYPNCFVLWMITAFISGCYSSFWDIKMDFGFLQKGQNFPLRNKLTYKNHLFYHVTIVVNVVLRFLWVLSVSPEIMSRMIRPEFLALVLYVLEMFRRGLWNFIRVEYEHLDMLKKFQISYYEELPFVKSEGEFVINSDKMIDIMNLEKEDKLRLELREIFHDVKGRDGKGNKSVNEGKRNDEEFARMFESYLEKYKELTLTNTGSYVRNMSK